jgi:hypothetical protein
VITDRFAPPELSNWVAFRQWRHVALIHMNGVMQGIVYTCPAEDRLQASTFVDATYQLVQVLSQPINEQPLLNNPMY